MNLKEEYEKKNELFMVANTALNQTIKEVEALKVALALRERELVQLQMARNKASREANEAYWAMKGETIK